ncbi:Uncharacterized protein YdcI [Durusdinium trenchii]|uniref:Uncharacterized protein YdcI n=1 Tax=Durusdinium trenchii TaxID=1381693 RepID=A0ABP0IX00_9DINO
MSHSELNLKAVAQGLGVELRQVEAALQLLDEGNTVPFITRYRKDRTGGLDETVLRQISEEVAQQRQLLERTAVIERSIEEQGRMTPELRRRIRSAGSMKRLEDLYLPYRPKRRSRADVARERGLQPLATAVLAAQVDDAQHDRACREAVAKSDELNSAEEAAQGVLDLLAENFADDADVREIVRQIAWRTGALQARFARGGTPDQTFRDYESYQESLARVRPHRVLAVNRGESLKALRVRVVWESDRAEKAIWTARRLEQLPARKTIRTAVEEALQRLVNPAIEREIRRDLTEKATRHAGEVFARNLRGLLLQPPLARTSVLAIDPGFRTGCKVVVLDEYGQLKMHDVIYLVGNDEKIAAMRERIARWVREYECAVIAIGNGTACRETEQLIADTIAEYDLTARYIVVNEAGASIYSTSEAAREEFAELDATVRGTVSIGRRLQDPLSELVKIDPQHVGVGMYQHDVGDKSLKESLDQVVETCVNYVGVELNQASAALLKYVSGLNQGLARKIVQWRDENGPFRSRAELLSVPGVGAATFTQAAGFLKITGGAEPFDGTWIHPESYELAAQVLQRCGMQPSDMAGGSLPVEVRQQLESQAITRLAEELHSDVFTISHILESLVRPGRDPRSDLPGPIFRREVLHLDDLRPGMELTGAVRNVVDFGAFVDVGLKDSGLVHVSQMSTQYVSSPYDVVSVGDIVTVWVTEIDIERRRIGLSLIPPEQSGL